MGTSYLFAATFHQFDHMNSDAQAEFVARMLDETEKALIREGNAAAAAQMDHLFTTVLPGDHMAVGLVEYERNEARARVFDAQRAEKDPKAERLDVEDALFVTLKKNNIVLSDKTQNAIVAALAKFHVQTYGEFVAQSPAEQRHNVGVLAKFAWPDSQLRKMVQDQIKGDKSATMDLLPEVVEKQFPVQSDDQPGFAPLSAIIRSENAKSSTATGPLFQLQIYLLQTADNQLTQDIDKMDAETVLMPDGRHVFQDKNGDLWAVRGQDDPGTKLTGADRELAERIGNCKAAHHITSGAQALAVCRVELGLPDAAPAPAPAAAPVMLGKLDVTHIAGLRVNDTEAQVNSVFGQSEERPGRKIYGPKEEVEVAYSGSTIKSVALYANNGVDWIRSRAGNDPFFKLLGLNESEAIALLGEPQEKKTVVNFRFLEWHFRIPSLPEPTITPGDLYTEADRSGQKLLLKFTNGSCSSVTLTW
jgi:hypothetical protein